MQAPAPLLRSHPPGGGAHRRRCGLGLAILGLRHSLPDAPAQCRRCGVGLAVLVPQATSQNPADDTSQEEGDRPGPKDDQALNRDRGHDRHGSAASKELRYTEGSRP